MAFNGLDTRLTHFTATIEVHSVTSAGLVSPTTYAADGKQVNRESEQVSKIVVRAATLPLLRDKVINLVASDAIY